MNIWTNSTFILAHWIYAIFEHCWYKSIVERVHSAFDILVFIVLWVCVLTKKETNVHINMFMHKNYWLTSIRQFFTRVLSIFPLLKLPIAQWWWNIVRHCFLFSSLSELHLFFKLSSKLSRLVAIEMYDCFCHMHFRNSNWYLYSLDADSLNLHAIWSLIHKKLVIASKNARNDINHLILNF